MRKVHKNLFIFVIMVFPIASFTQVSVLGNSGSAGNYIGWAIGNTFPLEIRHNANQPINFFTNSTQRMTILGSNGYVGIGITTPTSVLHINKTNTGEMFRTNGSWSLENRWRLFTTNTSTVEQFRLYVLDSTSDVFLQAQQATGNLSFNTAGGSSTNFPDTKLRIFPDDMDRMVAFENPNLTSNTTFVPAYNAKFIINDRNPTPSTSTLVDDALLLRVQGIGKLLPGRPSALASGASTGNFTMAEIISTRKNVGDAGLRLQGSRTNCTSCDIGFIDFANYDQVDPIIGSDVLFNMARLAAGSQARDSSRGFIRFYTNNGSGDPFSANDAGLLERMRINGFGDGFFNLRPVLGPANMMNVTARFNILDDDRPQLRLINFANNQNIAKIYTNLQSTDNGDLFLQPLDETQPEDSLYARFVGIHNPQPQNTLDIQSTKASPRWNELSTYGTSGLRFSNLSAINSPMGNPGKGVLAVDSNGNVVYVKAEGGFASCDDSINGVLDEHSKLDLNNYNFYFTNNDSINANLVAVGYDCGENLEAKFNVYSKNEVWSGSFYVNGANPATAAQQLFQGGVKSIIDSTNSENATAVYGYIAPNYQSEMLSQVGVKGEVDAFRAKEAIGVFGVATIQDPTGGAIGGRFLSSGSGFGRAVQAQNTTFETLSGSGTGFGFGGDFSCYNPLGTSVGSNTGLVGSADGKAQRNIGVLGRATGNGIFNCGVYGEASGGASNYAAYFQGDVYVNGTGTSGSGYLIASDQQFKNEINNFSNGLEILEEIAPKTYYLDTNNNYGINFPSTLQYGMIAQDVEQVLPSLVSEVTKPASYDSLGNVLTQEITYKSLNYNAFIPILISAVKEQNEKIDVQDEKIDSLNTVVDDLNNRLTQLENCLSGILPFLCQMSNSSIQQTSEMVQEQIRTAINVNLSDKNTIVLNQNVPNPFAESTVITYSIPATVVKGQIHFYDGQGKLINSLEITNRGAGQLNVFGEDLSSGTYTYSLVADGQIVSTKKMVKE